MIHKKALQLSGALAGRGIINPEDIAVYSYGFELMMSTAVNIFFVILISVLFSVPWAWIFFLLVFIPLRVTAGGYHAGTHLGCCAVFSVAYAVLLFPAVFLTVYMTPLVLLCLSALSLLTVLLLSPVPASSKPLDEAQRARNRKRSLLIGAAALVITAASFLAGPGLQWMFVFFALGQTGAAISLIAAKLAHKA
ncbi:accessory gene regulator B [Sporobacter termitidis DSM 10068]|uniref:Accessory gene regulator B n=1 Tax=Sporobacter termitidis DSM 10068 TaxID=1123282 RepID=A0A1M5ZDF8_9FIRM|nr:accessory gene regulator B family protein [Sporobacter termitidis]SHI22236.1 accessory gene regulator B [Sporobacter termitidis DSM 10068]